MARDRLLGDASVGLLDWLRGEETGDTAEGDGDVLVVDRDDSPTSERATDVQSTDDDSRTDGGSSASDSRTDGGSSASDSTRTASTGTEPASTESPEADDARATAADGGDRQWTDDDPIEFDVDDGADDQSLLDAVTPGSGSRETSGETAVLAGGLDDGIDEAATDRTTGDEPSELHGDGHDGDSREDSPGGDSQVDSPDGGSSDVPAAESATDPERAPVADSEGKQSAEEREDVRISDGDDDASSLHDRVASMEDKQGAVASNVEALESDVNSLHGELRNVRSDLETLVSLVKQTAPTRGGAAAADPPASERDPAPGDANGPGESTDSADGGAESTGGDDESDAESPTDDVEEASGQEPDAGSEPETSTEQSATQSSDGATGQSDADAESSASASRSLADPRSDSVGDRLRTYRERFEDGSLDGVQASIERAERRAESNEGVESSGSADSDGSANPDGSAESGEGVDPDDGDDGSEDELDALEFEFAKVLYPADDDGSPDAVGNALEQPYLEELPEGVAAEAAVIEWLDGIVAKADQAGAVQAVEFYESIDWLTAEVRDDLLGYLEGVGPVEDHASVTSPPEELELADHRRSLEYVTGLATGEVTADGI